VHFSLLVSEQQGEDTPRHHFGSDTLVCGHSATTHFPSIHQWCNFFDRTNFLPKPHLHFTTLLSKRFTYFGMKIRESFAIRITTIIGSAAMLIAYVVFSQAHQGKTIAPGSKFMRLEPIVESGLTNKASSKTNSLSSEPFLALPSSKGSIVPTLLAPTASTTRFTHFQNQTPKASMTNSAPTFSLQKQSSSEANRKFSPEK